MNSCDKQSYKRDYLRGKNNNDKISVVLLYKTTKRNEQNAIGNFVAQADSE